MFRPGPQESKAPPCRSGSNTVGKVCVEEKKKQLEMSTTIRTEEKGSCSKWVVDMKMEEEEEARWKQCCIYQVPKWIKDTTDSKVYTPQLASVGPFHHGTLHLLPMEKHKHRAMQYRVKRSGKSRDLFIAAIEEVANELEAAYDDLDEKWRGEHRVRFVELMVTDGCFLLELMRMAEIQMNGNEVGDYMPNDPVFSKTCFLKLWPTLVNDLIMLENQLPLVVLEKLLALCDEEFQGKTSTRPSDTSETERKDIERPGGTKTSPLSRAGNAERAGDINKSVESARDINRSVLCLLDCELKDGMVIQGLHLLDIYHKNYCGVWPEWEQSGLYTRRTSCAVELREAGIEFKRSNTDSIHDIDFERGVLTMPLFELYDNTGVILLNLMAFEWLHPDTKHNVASYIYFVDKLIESETDVAFLRSKGLFDNLTGSDKKAVELFNTLSKLTWPPKGEKLGDVQWRLNDHWRKRRNKWRAFFKKTYLSNPCVFMSFVAAIILLIATLMQTFYTVWPFYKGTFYKG